MKIGFCLGAGILAGFSVSPLTHAHHSNAMFDDSKEIEVSGTVHDFQWTNPHVFIELTVQGQDGPFKFIIESPTPGVLRAHGWKFNTLKPGDKVLARVRPLRLGQNGGYLVSMAKDGVPIGDGKTSSVTIQGNK
jgi:hypothetical protein